MAGFFKWGRGKTAAPSKSAPASAAVSEPAAPAPAPAEPAMEAAAAMEAPVEAAPAPVEAAAEPAAAEPMEEVAAPVEAAPEPASAVSGYEGPDSSPAHVSPGTLGTLIGDTSGVMATPLAPRAEAPTAPAAVEAPAPMQPVAAAEPAVQEAAPMATPAPTPPPARASSNGVFRSTMPDFPLTLQHTLGRAERLFANSEIVTNTAEGPRRTTYGAWARRVHQLAGALKRLGVQKGDRVATLAWNTDKHLELYFAVPCSGAVLHTLNLRLFPKDLGFIIQDAEDSVIFVDASLLPLLEKTADYLGGVRNIVVMNGSAQPSGTATVALPQLLDYEELLAGESEHFDWPELDERDAAAMCYTSGTTGNPKGVVYSHRSTMLHSLAEVMPDALNVTERDKILTFVPMFHANAWGLCQSAPLVGATLIFPNNLMDPVSVTRLMASEKATIGAGVPTIWNGMLQVLEKEPADLSALRFLICGGSAVSLALIEALDRRGLTIVQAWGMTEMSPLGTVSRVRRDLMGLPPEEQNRYRAKVGVATPLVDFKIVDDNGAELPWDGTSFGELLVRGPWITTSYYHDADPGKFTDGWLRTGDVATIDEWGYIGIVDRSKDVIKSGGEWISSIDLENAIMLHPQVFEAAVIGVPDPKWEERPAAYVVPKPDFRDSLTAGDVRVFLEPRVAKWWLPDEIIFVDVIPKTGVGKVDKKLLRTMHAEGRLPTA
jgi:fatty-acyl-CoA synthase